jgi:hypothetical protein
MGAPSHPILARFGQFIDQLEAYRLPQGDQAVSDLRPLWRFDLDEMSSTICVEPRRAAVVASLALAKATTYATACFVAPV